MKPNVVERVFAVILLFIAFGIVLHTPIAVLLSSWSSDFDLIIKSWKEILMGVALVLFVWSVWRRKLFAEFLNDRIIQLLIAYAGLHFILASAIGNDIQAIGAGLLIDLRYLLYFTLVYGAVRILPGFRTMFLKAVFAGSAVVLGFALLQMFVLPRDVLLSFGYGAGTIAPYLTVDDNEQYVRINSTLRGPNPLGAYAIILFALIVAAAIKYTRQLKNDHHWVVGLAIAASLLTLWVSYSRSALIGMLLAAGIIVFAVARPVVRKRLAIVGTVTLFVVASLLFFTRNDPTISHIVWHDDPNGGGRVDSNQGHAESLVDGTVRMIKQPFGGGIGSTGSASLLSDEPLIIENQYLFIAHETGWLGLALFGWIYVEVMRRLWSRRRSALSLGVFASGCALAVVGLLLPVWVDDTVAIVWWGLAGLGFGAGGWEMGNRMGKIGKDKGRKRHGA